MGNKGIIAIENNMNIEVSYCKYNNETYIEIIPYDRELNIDYVLYWIKKIKKEYTNFGIYIQNYCIDGLSETNNDLIFNGSKLWNKYTEQYRTIKIN